MVSTNHYFSFVLSLFFHLQSNFTWDLRMRDFIVCCLRSVPANFIKWYPVALAYTDNFKVIRPMISMWSFNWKKENVWKCAWFHTNFNKVIFCEQCIPKGISVFINLQHVWKRIFRISIYFHISKSFFFLFLKSNTSYGFSLWIYSGWYNKLMRKE